VPLRAAWSIDLDGWVDVEPDVRNAFMAVVNQLAELGWDLEEAAPPYIDPAEFVDVIYQGGSGSGDGASAASLHVAERERDRYAEAWERFLKEFDVLVTPGAPQVAPPIPMAESVNLDESVSETRDVSELYRFSTPATMTGQPAVSVPMGFDDTGLPIGLQIMARRFSDDVCIQAAAIIEQTMRKDPHAAASQPSACASPFGARLIS
jgi:aspartyl-tRNA(Asn)/glutamyl-tRNA(Gln) amidotransferase subunit A